MAASELLTRRELAFLEALVEEEVAFMIVGLAAAALQGAPAVTEDVDLWFGDPGGRKMLRALERTGVVYIPPTAWNPPLLAGEGAELFDVVVHMHGLESFEDEVRGARLIRIGRLSVPVLPLARIIASKEATGRPKDRAILPALRDALRALETPESDQGGIS